MKHKIITKKHIDHNGACNTWQSVFVNTGQTSKTFDDTFSSEFFLVRDGKAYIVDAIDGDAIIHYADEYTGWEIPLKQMDEIEFCANENDLPIVLKAIAHIKNVMRTELNAQLNF